MEAVKLKLWDGHTGRLLLTRYPRAAASPSEGDRRSAGNERTGHSSDENHPAAMTEDNEDDKREQRGGSRIERANLFSETKMDEARSARSTALRGKGAGAAGAQL